MLVRIIYLQNKKISSGKCLTKSNQPNLHKKHTWHLPLTYSFYNAGLFLEGMALHAYQSLLQDKTKENTMMNWPCENKRTIGWNFWEENF